MWIPHYVLTQFYFKLFNNFFKLTFLFVHVAYKSYYCLFIFYYFMGFIWIIYLFYLQLY